MRLGATSRRTIGHFLRHRGGGIAVIFAIALPALCALLGVVTDYYIYTLVRTHLQAAADGAAIAGARELSIVGIKDTQIKAMVVTYLAHEVKAENGPMTAETTIDKKKYSVDVSLEQDWTPIFAHLIDVGMTSVRVAATAVLAGTTNVCVLTLEPKGGAALHLDMIARLDANGCGVYSNSSSSQGIRVDLLASIEAELICSAGGVTGLLTKMTPSPTTDCPVLPDPLAKRPAPGAGACSFNKLVIKNQTKTLGPGTYCGGIEIKGKSKVHFAPGTYVIKDGRFRVTDQSSVDGTNVGFYLLGNASTIDFTGNTSISFSGAENGSMAGLLFFEDRDAQVGRNHRINSAKAHELTGTIYLPRGRLRIDPNSLVAADSAYTAIIAYQLELSEGPTLVLNSDYGATAVPVPDGIKVTGQVVLTR